MSMFSYKYLDLPNDILPRRLFLKRNGAGRYNRTLYNSDRGGIRAEAALPNVVVPSDIYSKYKKL
jgi:hypothetical protein